MIPDTISPHPIAPETTQDTDTSAAKTPDGVIVGTTILDLQGPLLEEVLRWVEFSSRVTCRTFREAVDLGRYSLYINWGASEAAPEAAPEATQYKVMEDMLSRLPLLIDLNAPGCPNRGFDFNALRTCAKLRSLDFSNTIVKDISGLSVCTALVNLNLSSCPDLDDVGVLASCNALTLLVLNQNFSLSNIGPLEACTRLRCLELISCNVVDIGPRGRAPT